MKKISVDNLAKIESILFGKKFPIKLEKETLKLTYLLQGKTSEVYKVELAQNRTTYAIKVFNPEQWQVREIDIYKKFLICSPLNIPKLIFSNKSEGILVLSWIESSSRNVDFNQLSNWLTIKYLFFKNNLDGNSINIHKNISWMILDPISKISKLSEYSNIKIIHNIIKNKELICEKLLDTYMLKLPIVLDHADLEIPNILSTQDHIYIIDWANAIKSLGFIDFAQFKKLLRENNKIGLYKLYEKKFSKLLNLNIKEFTCIISLFAIIREVQLLSYYASNNIKVKDSRVTSSILILQEESRFLLI